MSTNAERDNNLDLMWNTREVPPYPLNTVINSGLQGAVHNMRRTLRLLRCRETDWEQLAGRSVLDLACGSRNSPNELGGEAIHLIIVYWQLEPEQGFGE